MRRITFLFLSTVAAAGVRGQTWFRVAYDNCGVPEKQPHLLSGDSYRYPEEDVPAGIVPSDSPARTVAFGASVLFAYTGLNREAPYRVRMTFQSDAKRELRVRFDDTVADGAVVLDKAPPVTRDIQVPASCIADGALMIAVEKVSGPNAVVSEIEVLSPDRTPLSPGSRSLAISAKDREEARELVSRLRPRYTPIPVSPGEQARPAVSLNGTWQFHPSPPEGFEKQQNPGDDWKLIEVPGEWIMQGFTVPTGTAAGYWRAFELPPSRLPDGRVILRFDAVYSACTVWVNGTEVGGHLGGFTPFELDITDAVKPGRNVLALGVKNESLADALASGTQYAAHVLGGISRKVTLFRVPRVHVSSLHVVAELDDSLRTGTATAQVEVTNARTTDTTVDVRYTVFACVPDGGRAEPETHTETIRAGATAIVNLQSSIRNPSPWHPEHPNLYMAHVDLLVAGRSVESVERRFGFRRVEIKGNQLFVNHVPVKLRGVCRHEVHPLRGRSLPEGQWRRDVEVLRAGNVNHIRTSHYPPAEELMDAADELGMFVEAEGPFCWAHNAKADAAAIREATVRQLLELVERDRSHPCILYWSLANESRWNSHFAAASLAVRELDPTHPQTFNFFPWGGAVTRPDEACCEIGTDHYPGPGGPAKYADFSRPVSYGEYCHLNAYNRHELVTDPGVRDAWGRGMAAMWEAMWQSRGTLGGSLWAGIDDTFFVPPDLTVGYGTWGPIDGWRRPKPEYWHMKKAYSPVKVLTRALPRAPGKPVTIKVANRFDDTNLGQTKLEAWWEGTKEPLHVIRADVAPRTVGSFSVPPPRPADSDALRLRFTGPRGFVVDEYRLPVRKDAATSALRPRSGTLSRSVTDDAVDFHGGGIQWRVSKESGLLMGRLGDTPVVLAGPHLMVLPLNGAGGTQMKGKMPTYAPYTATCEGWRTKAVRVEPDRVVVEGAYREAEGSFTIRAVPGNVLEVSYAFTVLKNVNPRQVGLVFELPKAFDSLSWERDGLWSYYPGDHIGRLVGTCRAFEGMHPCGPAGPRTRPDWPWRLDGNELGSNDFRSTKENIRRVCLTAPQGRGVEVRSDGTQHARAWVDGDRVHFLIADYANPGAERFFRRHASREDRPLKQGDTVEGTVRIALIPDGQ